MGRDALIGLVAFVLAAAAAASPIGIERPLTVDEAWANLDELDGKTIQIAGTLRACRQGSCVIAANMAAGAKWLGVDLSDEARFDPDTLIRHRLIIEGRFDATCLRKQVLCIDSATMMHKAHIVEVP